MGIDDKKKGQLQPFLYGKQIRVFTIVTDEFRASEIK